MRKYLIICLFLIRAGVALAQGETIDLSGNWSFQIDKNDTGISEKWFSKTLTDQITLPGSMTSNGKGDDITLNTNWTGSIFDSSWFKKPEYAQFRREGNIKVPFWLQPVKYYKGAAWYQKTFTIPAGWNSQFIELFIERAHWETTVWVDDVRIGAQNSLGTPHIYKFLNTFKPGTHTVTIRVDNRTKQVDVGQNSHSISDHTQTNWNGMIGKLEVRPRPRVHLTDIKIFPDVVKKKALVKLTIENATGKFVNASLLLFAQSYGKRVNPVIKEVKLQPQATTLEVEYAMGDDVALWSEFTPAVYDMTVSLTADSKVDKKDVRFGMRNFSTSGTQFTINNIPVFLRGTLECAIFPKTGFPPTNRKEWTRIFSICKSFGLNHVRFHSWCPPEAAFYAADSLGVYLQIESSSWANWGTSLGDDLPIDKYIYEESTSIVDTYGNHPSFCLMAYGNEPGGKNHVRYLTEFVNHWKAKDNRRQYTTGAGWPAIPENNYNNVSDPRIQHWLEGTKSIINSKQPSFQYDWSSITKQWTIPTVSHEIGQWCVYPDLKEMAQYDGVVRAKNFEIFEHTLRTNGMYALADSFLLASGKLQTLCYKADIEAALRTKNFGGFQLLDLHDFPGQGTALVGVLNPFWKEKGYVSSNAFSQFCNAVVPLARFPKMIYLNNEELNVPVEVSNFSGASIDRGKLTWSVTNNAGKVLFSGVFDKPKIPVGNTLDLGSIKQPLNSITLPSRLVVSVSINSYRNSWDIFVYPAVLPSIRENILITSRLDEKALAILNKGGKVLLSVQKGSVKPGMGGDVEVGFSSIFWNTAWTNGQAPHTLGILCDPKHKALASFPTDYHSNWQWWDGMTHSNVIRLDSLEGNLKPIVRVIDDWVTARPLGLVFECAVGKGKLMVSGIDLVTDLEQRNEARQLLFSLQQYMSGQQFNPTTAVSAEKIVNLFQN